MNGENWWRPRFGDPRREEEGDRCLFALLARGKLLRSLPPGADETLPAIGAALEAILAAGPLSAAGPESAKDAENPHAAPAEGVAPRPGNPFPPFPSAGGGIPPSFPGW